MKKNEFKDFFEIYFDSIRSYLYYHCGDADLATDIAQETFVKVWEKQFDIQNERIKGLLYKIAREMLISRYRRKIVERKYLEKLRFDYQEDSPADVNLEYQELKNKYETALAQLTPGQREVFLMSRNENLKYYEIAERLNISIKAVEKRMSGALTYLRNVLNFVE